MHALALLCTLPQAFGSIKFQGEDSSIRFGRTLDTVLTASCDGDAPSWKYLTPSMVDASNVNNPDGVVLESNASVTVYLHNVAPTCIYSSINTPCAAHTPVHPPLFYCAWAGATDNLVMSPVAAQASPETLGGVHVGFEVNLKCPIPSIQRIHTLSEYQFDGAEGRLRLVLTYFAAAGDEAAVAVPFAGVTQGDHVTFHSMVAPPSPPLPMPPPAPPLLPLNPSPPPPRNLKLKVRVASRYAGETLASAHSTGSYGNYANTRGKSYPIRAGAYYEYNDGNSQEQGHYLHLETSCNSGNYRCQAQDV